MAVPNVSEEDIDALARIVYAEAQIIAKETGDLKAAYGSALDVVLNRVAANQRHYGGDSIQGGCMAALRLSRRSRHGSSGLASLARG